MIRKVESLNEVLQDMEAQIRNRAYGRFLERGGQHGRELEDWSAACADLLVRPRINLTETKTSFVVLFQIRAAEMGELECLATDRAILLQSGEESIEIPGLVHIREFEPRRVFRYVAFPRTIDPNAINIEDEGNILRVTIAVPESAPVRRKSKSSKAKPKSKKAAQRKSI